MLGAAAFQYGKLQAFLDAVPVSGQLTVKGERNGASSINLSRPALEAIIALLMEREAVLMSSLGVEVEKTV